MNKASKSYLSVFLILTIFLILFSGFVLPQETIKKDIVLGNESISYNPIWEKYKPVEINNFFGLGETLMEEINNGKL